MKHVILEKRPSSFGNHVVRNKGGIFPRITSWFHIRVLSTLTQNATRWPIRYQHRGGFSPQHGNPIVSLSWGPNFYCPEVIFLEAFIFNISVESFFFMSFLSLNKIEINQASFYLASFLAFLGFPWTPLVTLQW